MAHITITIIGIEDDGKLILSPSRDIVLRQSSDNHVIKWKIDTSKVKSFLFEEKEGSYPFTDELPSKFKKEIVLNTKKSVIAEWKYSIKYVKCDDTIHVDDPLISIRSTYLPGDDEEEDDGKLITSIITLIGLVAISLFLWQRNKRSIV